jgi:hypothetical protein
MNVIMKRMYEKDKINKKSGSCHQTLKKGFYINPIWVSDLGTGPQNSLF